MPPSRASGCRFRLSSLLRRPCFAIAPSDAAAPLPRPRAGLPPCIRPWPLRRRRVPRDAGSSARRAPRRTRRPRARRGARDAPPRERGTARWHGSLRHAFRHCAVSFISLSISSSFLRASATTCSGRVGCVRRHRLTRRGSRGLRHRLGRQWRWSLGRSGIGDGCRGGGWRRRMRFRRSPAARPPAGRRRARHRPQCRLPALPAGGSLRRQLAPAGAGVAGAAVTSAAIASAAASSCRSLSDKSRTVDALQLGDRLIDCAPR